MTSYTEADIKPSLLINCNGYPGAVTEVCTGQISGMCVVRLRSGSVCVSISELVRFQNNISAELMA